MALALLAHDCNTVHATEDSSSSFPLVHEREYPHLYTHINNPGYGVRFGFSDGPSHEITGRSLHGAVPARC